MYNSEYKPLVLPKLEEGVLYSGVANTTEEYAFFVRGPFSPWYHSPFKCTNYISYVLGYTGKVIDFNSLEQWVCYSKAVIMKDSRIADLIVKESDSRKVKELSRKIFNFNVELWDKLKFSIYLEGVLLKFFNNPLFNDILKYHVGKKYIYATKSDLDLGCGFYPHSPNILIPEKWYGGNLLGEVITVARDIYFEGENGKTYIEYIKNRNILIDEIIKPLIVSFKEQNRLDRLAEANKVKPKSLKERILENIEIPLDLPE